jgi:tetratricopeptide (TPR) repeat protein
MGIKRTSDDRDNITELDVRNRLSSLSFELKIEYLENLLKRLVLPNDVKYTASKLLTDLYLQKGWITSAARAMERAAEAVNTFNERKEIFMNVGMLYIKALEPVFAGDAFKKAIDAASPGERAQLHRKIRDLWMSEAEALERANKRPKAIEIYEKMFRSTTDSYEQDAILKKLGPLYEKLGRIKDSIGIRESLKKRAEERDRPKPVKEQTVNDILADL